MMGDIGAEFEAMFPPSAGVFWDDNSGCYVREYGNKSLTIDLEQNARWQGYQAATEAARGDITQSYGQRFEAWWNGRHPQMRNWPDHSVAWSAYRQGLRDAKFDAKTDRAGDMVSVDVSTCDDDAGHRVFASLTGEFNDGFWLAELDHFNYTQPPAPVVPDRINPRQGDGPHVSAYINGWNDCRESMVEGPEATQ